MAVNPNSNFSNFTNLYSLSKTLRFELVPVGKTLENMRDHLRYDPHRQTFLADQEIEDAYLTLKPHLDSLHEKFITGSLESETAQKIDFSKYLEEYRNKKDFEANENKLRASFVDVYLKAGESWKKKYNEYPWKKGSTVAKGASVLSCQDVLWLIKDLNSDDERIKEIVKVTFKDFFTYLSGFNQNRENYYITKDEKSTAVATRIVNENLPKFCDNLIQFEYIIKKNKDHTEERIERKSEYLNAYKYLNDQGKTTRIKDAESGKMIDAYGITEDIFQISHFSSCLSQKGIEEYNRVIGHYNLLINLYNQAKQREEKHLDKKEKSFKRLPQFKTLYNQIGCGKKVPPFIKLTHDTKAQAQENKENYKKPYSVEQILGQAKMAGEKYFQGKSIDGVINTVPEFLNYILEKENDKFKGVYWSKASLNTISNKYFANYHDLKDRLKAAKVFQKAAKGSEEDVKIPDAIELVELFAVLDKVDNWKDEDVFFKKSLTEELKNEKENTKNYKRRQIIEEAKNSSQALLRLIFSDIHEHIEQFFNTSSTVLELKEYQSKESKEIIKAWIDHALTVNQMLKYFLVKENKIKGNPLDSTISNYFRTILFEWKIEQSGEDIPVKWFEWYDALRNYLTKKHQDDAKENKLKLNFENSTLAGGWDVNKEPDNYCVILQDQKGRQYLAIIAKQEKQKGFNKIFEKSPNNPLYKIDNDEVWRKMEYDFWSDVSRMIPKCSTQLKDVIKHFNKSSEDFIFPVGYKVTSGEKFSEECKITKRDFELNNKVYKKDDITISSMRYDLSDKQEKQYIKSFQKEYWGLLLKQEYPNVKLSEQQIILEWDKFCNKKSSELSQKEKLYKDALIQWIDFCKYFLSKYPKTKLFEYSFKRTEDYKSIDEFYLDVDICSYKLKVDTKINKTLLDQLVDEGEIYLFEIRNQDSNEGKKEGHKNNLHTLYWKTLFENIDNRPKLNGEAELFYRKALSYDKQEIIKDKYGKKIIKNFRFSKERFLFHVPITLNFCLKNENINNVVNTRLINQDNIHFLGIDRGEKHLAYYSLINQKGEIIDQGTLNLPFTDKDDKPRSIKKEKYVYNKQKDIWEPKELDCWNYNDLLDAMASNRDMARKNWQTIGTIKELKEGYISQVVKKIADLAVEHNAFIVLEDLNTGFKRGRQKIEKSVYQKFELALAKKLNFLVDKSAKNGEIGSVTKALQLTPPVNNYGDIENRKQVGIILYTRANYTSQTDPITGWRKTIYLKKGSEENIKKQIVDTFTDIRFDGKDYYFEYICKNTERPPWKLYSGKDGKRLDRFRGSRGKDKNEWTIDLVDVVSILDQIFVNFDKNRSILSQIIDENVKLEKPENSTYTAWESLRFAIDLIQQIRNTGEAVEDQDFILSPVRDKTSNHFDSRLASVGQPNCGDANGAYNIARKGIIMSEHIKNKYKLFISDPEWDAWLEGSSSWNKWLESNKNYLTQKST